MRLLCNLMVMVSTVLWLNGCAHKNYIEQANSLFIDQQYEAAVVQFNLALKEKPKDIATQNQLISAKQQLHRWATALEPQADAAYTANNQGKALLLYAKIAQITQSPHAIARYKMLYSTLSEQSVLRAQVAVNHLSLSNDTLASFDGISFQPNAAMVLTFEQSTPIFETKEWTQRAISQYISGSQLIANPELVSLQQQVSTKKNKQSKLQHKIRRLQHKKDQATHKIQHINDKIQRIEMLMLATHQSPATLTKYQKQLATLQHQLESAQQQQRAINDQLTQHFQSSAHIDASINHIVERLAMTLPLIQVPIYADYSYQTHHQTNTLTGTIYLNVSGVTRTASASVTSSDISHLAHPRINLAANPMSLLSKDQLMEQYQAQCTVIARRMLFELIDEHKASYILRARNTPDIEQKITLLVQHGLSTQDGASKTAANQLNRMLVAEFGHGGIFAINQLLHLYR